MRDFNLIRKHIWRAGLCLILLLSGTVPGRAEVHLTEAEAKAAATEKPSPEYPPMARQLKVVGKVELQISISPEGKVDDVKIVSGNLMLAKACAKVAAQWKFNSILQDGKPARAVAPLSFTFQ